VRFELCPDEKTFNQCVHNSFVRCNTSLSSETVHVSGFSNYIEKNEVTRSCTAKWEMKSE
jgi:hypothetical protein